MGMLQNTMAGAVGGFAAGMVMTGVMMMGKRAGFVTEPLPLKVERWAERVVGVEERTAPQQEQMIAMGGHLAYSAALGAGYALLQSLVKAPPVPAGPLYGLAVYATNLAGVGPALGISRPPPQQPPMVTGRQMMMHLVYGMVTGLVFEQLRD